MKKAFLFAMTLTGTFIGAGFATGQEILSFFVMQSPAGAVFYVFSCFIMLLICRMTAGREGVSAPEFYEELFGRKTGNAVFLISIFSLFACFSAAASGTGRLFEEFFALTYFEGVAAMIIVSILICRWGIEGLYVLNCILTPVIVLLSAVFGFISAANPDTVAVANVLHSTERMVTPAISAVLYAGYNIFPLIPVCLGAGEKDIRGYAVAFFVCSAAGIAVCLSLRTHYDAALLHELPFLSAVGGISSFASKAYSAVLLFALLTTAASCFYGFENGMREFFKIKRESIYIIAFAGLILMLPFGFSGIIQRVYPVFGAVGSAVMLFVVLKCRKK